MEETISAVDTGGQSIEQTGAPNLIPTALEDRTLLEELPGYAGYARRRRYRLLPGIW